MVQTIILDPAAIPDVSQPGRLEIPVDDNNIEFIQWLVREAKRHGRPITIVIDNVPDDQP